MESTPNEVAPSKRLRTELLELETLIYEQDWLHKNEHEPRDAANKSIFAEFLKRDGETSLYSCQFDECVAVRDGQDRAIAHIRGHFGHKPFACGGACGVSLWYVVNGAHWANLDALIVNDASYRSRMLPHMSILLPRNDASIGAP